MTYKGGKSLSTNDIKEIIIDLIKRIDNRDTLTKIYTVIKTFIK
jgi:hypothetical protein